MALARDPPWNGWWGDDPPYHAPVFVLTHHPREPLAMDGGTTFHFVTDGIESALEQARAAAGDKDVVIAGGADVDPAVPRGRATSTSCSVTSCPCCSAAASGCSTASAPTSGSSVVRVVEAPGVTHLRYRVVR